MLSDLPRRRGDEAGDQRRHDGEEAVDQRCRDRVGVARAERDERARQPELDEPDAARRDRDRAEDPGQRPGGERLDDRHLGARHADRADRGDQDEEDRQMPGERRRGEEEPAPADQLDRLPAKAHERRAVPLDGRLVDQRLGPAREPGGTVADAAREARARQTDGEARRRSPRRPRGR